MYKKVSSPEVTKSALFVRELRAELGEVAAARRAHDAGAVELENRPKQYTI